MAEIKNKVTFKGNPVTLVGTEVKAGEERQTLQVYQQK